MKKKINKFLYWTPRILAIVFILFLAMFSLDVFEGNYGFWGTLGGLFMHNIPALILLAVTIISWKREIVGAIVFILFGILYILRIAIGAAISSQPPWHIALYWSLIIAGPAFLTGILFLINWFKKKK